METYLQSKKEPWLPWFYKGILILSFLILTVRLVDLQVIRGAYFGTLASENRLRRVVIDAPRGQILARNGEVLVGEKKVEKAIIFDLLEGYKKEDTWTGEPYLISETLRIYPIGSAFAHLGGFVNEAGEDEVGTVTAGCEEKGAITLGQKIGRGGLEERYDCILRGIPGEALIEIEASGKKKADLGLREPVAGSDIQTFIDYKLQKALPEILGDKTGVIIVSKPGGQILAMYSSPSYDPNTFVSYSKKGVEQVLKDPALPLFNRAISGIYPPGSIFKPLVAIAALTEGAIASDFRFADVGFLEIVSLYGSFRYNNWYYTQYGGTEGEIDLARALARSTDTFFYKVGELTGVDKLASWGEKFGIGRLTAIDLPGEVAGIMPSAEWKLKERGERWFLGNTYHLAIGQGDLATTPIGIHQALTVINSGKICKPQIVNTSDKIEDCEDLGIAQDTLEEVTRGMIAACTSGGTGFTFFDINEKDSGSVACKTGTAQTYDHTDPHAWFHFASPAKNPEIVVTVLVEHGGEGSKVAGPIARSVFDVWFNN